MDKHWPIVRAPNRAAAFATRLDEGKGKAHVPRTYTAREEADHRDIERNRFEEQREEIEAERINAQVREKWGSLSRPEPKSIHSPAPMPRIRREAPKKRVSMRPNVDHNADLSVRSKPATFPGERLIGGSVRPRDNSAALLHWIK